MPLSLNNLAQLAAALRILDVVNLSYSPVRPFTIDVLQDSSIVLLNISRDP